LRRAELIEALRGVAGWLTDDEAWALHEVARANRSGSTVVEIGSWQGRSTIALASGLRARGAGTVYAVDPHSDSALHRATGVLDTHSAFVANVHAAGLADYVRAVRATSLAARERFAERSVHFLFVDGSHLFEDVVSDIDAWTPALADGAAVAFHDARDEPGVRRALGDRVEPEDSAFHQLRRLDNLLLARFRRPAQPTDSAGGASTGIRSM
jgi:predicted O-methyltransferase YrrM